MGMVARIAQQHLIACPYRDANLPDLVAEKRFCGLDAGTGCLGAEGWVRREKVERADALVGGLFGYIAAEQRRDMDPCQSVEVIHLPVHGVEIVGYAKGADVDEQPVVVECDGTVDQLSRGQGPAVDTDRVRDAEGYCCAAGQCLVFGDVGGDGVGGGVG